MTLKNMFYGFGMLAGLGGGAYFMHIYSLTKFLEPLPTDVAASYVDSMNRIVGNDGSRRHFAFAYQVPTVFPSNHILAEVFGKKAVTRQASYVSADGAKNVASVFAEKEGNGSLGAIFALQALEKTTPLKQLRATALFWDNLKISRQFNYLMHNRAQSLATARKPIVNAESFSVALEEAQQYCATVRELTEEKVVSVDPAQRMATLQTSCETALGVALVQASKEKPKPREATMYVVYSAPVPEEVEEGSWNYKIRLVWGDWYTRWIAVNAASALPHLQHCE